MSDEPKPCDLIEFRHIDQKQRLYEKHRYDKPCSTSCRQVELHSHTRSCVCKTCGKVWEPYDYLVRLSRNWTTYRADYDKYMADVAEARGRIEELTRLEVNAKARWLNAKKRLKELGEEAE
ncbi:MAG: hypothetical protein E1N59_2864 [Puniceicoccaceae bacterium 5H]|nr:MAG: hypothetical protein E1N59_2864 [Puniceicoccaceae bacterium 5H]